MKRLLKLGYENSYEEYYEYYILHVKREDFHIQIRRYRGYTNTWECNISYKHAHWHDKVIKSNCSYGWVKKFTSLFK